MQTLLVTIVLVGAFICSGMAMDRPLLPVQRQRIELGKDPGRYNFSVYASKPMNSDMSRTRHIVIIQHGLQRNALDYFNAGMKLMIASGVSKDGTLLIAPDFFATPDIGTDDPQRFPFWKVMGWHGGDDSINAPHVSSFRVFDDLLTLVMDKARFPSLASVVIAGHSDGAAFVQRYAVLNKVHRKFQSAGIDLRYVIANSPSYLYFTLERPAGHSFAPYNSSVCSSYNEYRYGIDRIIPYAGGRNGQQLFMRYAGRATTYLLGAEDKDPNHRVLDKSCGAEAQGGSRLKRGLAYVRYEHHLADRQINLKRHAYEVIGVGHSYEEMFASRCGLSALFGLADEKIPGGAVCLEITN